MKKTILSTCAAITLVSCNSQWGSNCPQNSWFDGYQCNCNNGMVMANGYCTPSCGQYEIWNGSVCDCAKGYAKLDGVNCQKCPKHAHYNPKKYRCECDFGYTSQNNKCVSTPGYTASSGNYDQSYNQPENYQQPQPNNQYNQPNYNQDQGYGNVQQNQYYEDNQNDDSIPIYDYQDEYGCNILEEFDGNQCICKRGLIRFNGQCRPCPDGSNFDCNTGTCICDSSSYYDPNNNVCLSCGLNEFYSSYRQACKCVKGYKRYDGVNCRQCPVNSKFDKSINACRCNAGRYWNKTKCDLL